MSLSTELSARQRMSIHIETLYRCNAEGRLHCVNEPGDPPAPRFYMGRSLEGNAWRFHEDLPAAIVAQLEPLCQAEPIATDLTQPPHNYAAIKAVLAAHAPIENEYRGPTYWLPAREPAPSNAVLITDDNAALLQPFFPWLARPDSYRAFGPVAVVVEQEQAVTICFCCRKPGQATEAGLETQEGYRGKGYAVAAVALWAAAVRQQGWLPLYGTSWENLASQGVARKLGAVMYGEDWSVG
jgi:GNAT acetyltransferase